MPLTPLVPEPLTSHLPTHQLVNTWNLGNYYVVGGSGRVIPAEVTTVVDGLKSRAQAAGAKVVASLTDDVDAAVAAAR